LPQSQFTSSEHVLGNTKPSLNTGVYQHTRANEKKKINTRTGPPTI